MWQRLKSLDRYTLDSVPVDQCREFEPDPFQEEKEITLSLTFAAWRLLARESANQGMFKALENAIIPITHTFTLSQWQNIADECSDPRVRNLLEAEGIKAQVKQWIGVDSSCISAIAYNEVSHKLKIRFVSNLTYEYDNLLYDTFSAFSEADSKGRFFNLYIKDQYPYRLL